MVNFESRAVPCTAIDTDSIPIILNSYNSYNYTLRYSYTVIMIYITVYSIMVAIIGTYKV